MAILSQADGHIAGRKVQRPDGSYPNGIEAEGKGRVQSSRPNLAAAKAVGG